MIICFLMEKKSLSLKPTIKILTFQLDFVFESISNGFSATESREVSIGEIIMIFHSITILLINLTYYTFTSI